MFKLFGPVGQKYIFSVEVHEVVLPDMLEYFDGTEALCVSFEPNPKKPAVYTADKSVLLNKKDEIVAQFKETLKSDVTLYKDAKSGLYKEKIGKVYVLQRKRGLAGLGANNKDAFKTIGVVMIPLHEIVLDENGAPSTEQHDLQMHLLACVSENCYVNLTVSGVEKESASETSSVHSNDTKVTATVASSSSTSATKGNSGSIVMQKPSAASKPSGVGPSIAETEDDHSGSEGDDHDGAGSGHDGNPYNIHALNARYVEQQNKNSTSSSISSAAPNKQPVTAIATATASNRNSSNGGSSSSNGNVSSPIKPMQNNPMLLSGDKVASVASVPSTTKPPLAPATSATVVPKAASSGRYVPPPASRTLSPDDIKFEASALYAEMKSRIHDLENALLASEDIVFYERTRAKEAAEQSANQKATSKQISDLKSEIHNLKEENEKLTEMCQEYSVSASKTNDNNSRLQNQLTKVADELDLLQREKLALEVQLEALTKDNESILSDLITAKVTNGNLAAEAEEARHELDNLKNKIQAQKAARMGPPGGGNAGAPASGGVKVNLDQRLAEHQQQLQQNNRRPNNENGPQSANKFRPPASNSTQQQQNGGFDSSSMQTPQRPSFLQPQNNQSAPSTSPSQRGANGNNPSAASERQLQDKLRATQQRTSQQQQQQQQQPAPVAPSTAPPAPRVTNPFANMNSSTLLRGFDSIAGKFGGGNASNNQQQQQQDNNSGANGASGTSNTSRTPSTGMMRGFGNNNNAAFTDPQRRRKEEDYY